MKLSLELQWCSHLKYVFVLGAGCEAMAARQSEVERVAEDCLQDSVILFIRTLRQVQLVKRVQSSWYAGDLNMAQVRQINRTLQFKKITLR